MNAIRDFYAANGYWIARGVFSPAEVLALEQDFDRVVAQLQRSNEATTGLTQGARWRGPEMDRLRAAGTVVLHTHNVQQYSAAWLGAIQQPAFLAVAEAMLGPDIVLHHTKLFQKPAENGAPFPVHQDWSYFPTERDSMLAAIIHVSAATDAMGCLRVYPGSHALGRVPHTSAQKPNELLARHPLEGATPLEAAPGAVVFISHLLLHGSRPNRSSEARKTVLVQMHAGDDMVSADAPPHPNENLVLRGWNHRTTRARANASRS